MQEEQQATRSKSMQEKKQETSKKERKISFKELVNGIAQKAARNEARSYVRKAARK